MVYLLAQMALAAKTKRPSLEAIVARGIFEECAAAIEAVSAGGTEQLQTVGVYNLVAAMRLVLNCRSHPGCEARIRSLATALEFCLQHDRASASELGVSSAQLAASIGEPVCATARHVVRALLTDRCIH